MKFVSDISNAKCILNIIDGLKINLFKSFKLSQKSQGDLSKIKISVYVCIYCTHLWGKRVVERNSSQLAPKIWSNIFTFWNPSFVRAQNFSPTRVWGKCFLSEKQKKENSFKNRFYFNFSLCSTELKNK